MRWDVHNHAVPREAVELLRSASGYRVRIDGASLEADRVRAELTPEFLDPAVKLDQLHRLGLEAAVVSGAPPLFAYEADPERGEALCLAVNSGLAEFCAHDPHRLRWLAHVPLQAPGRAADVLGAAAAGGAVGAHIGTSVAGTPLDRAGLEPFWAAAEELDMAVMLHPAYNNPHPGLEGYHLQNAVGNQLETTIAATCPGRLGACATRRRSARSWPERRPTHGLTLAASSWTPSPTTLPRCVIWPSGPEPILS
jgi:aminocarboxymuconate-semialdehyde decarboxylase